METESFFASEPLKIAPQFSPFFLSLTRRKRCWESGNKYALSKKNPKSVQLQFESILHFLSRSPPWAFQLHTETHFSVYLYVYFERPESAALLSVWAHSTLFGLRISSKEKRLFAHKLIRLWRPSLSLSLSALTTSKSAASGWKKGCCGERRVADAALSPSPRAATDRPRFAESKPSVWVVVQKQWLANQLMAHVALQMYKWDYNDASFVPRTRASKQFSGMRLLHADLVDSAFLGN